MKESKLEAPRYCRDCGGFHKPADRHQPLGLRTGAELEQGIKPDLENLPAEPRKEAEPIVTQEPTKPARKPAKPRPLPIEPEARNEAARALVALRWSKTSDSERKKVGAMLLAARAKP